MSDRRGRPDSLAAVSDAKILTLCGSLRGGSVNAATMRAALANPPAGVEFDTFDVRPLPFYDGDVEAQGLPEAVEALGAALEAADGLIIFSPEYNGSFPAVTKNAIDWLSRPPRPWENKGMTMVVTTPGSRAGKSIRDHFDAVMGHFPVKHFPAHGIGSYGEILGEDGEVGDAATIDALRAFVAAFAAHLQVEDEKD